MKAKAKSKAKAAAAKAKAKKQAAKKQAARGEDDGEDSAGTKHYSPAKTAKKTQKEQTKARGRPKKVPAEDDLEGQRKARLSRKSSAYHVAKSKALKQGKSLEDAVAAAKQATWLLQVVYGCRHDP